MYAALSNTEQGQLALIAAEVAKDAAQLIRTRRSELDQEALRIETKASPTDVVTIIDRESETLIRTKLSRLRPHDEIVGEEGVDINSDATSGIRWIIDPLDGTVNAVYEIAAYAVSVACEVGGEVVAGAVVDIPRGLTYLAASGEGAYLETAQGYTKLKCNQPTSLATAMLATGFSCLPQRRQQQGELFTKIIGRVRDVRRLGAAALDCCLVAAGQFDAYYEHGISGWDFAAGALIAKEAGAVVVIPSTDAASSLGNLVFIASPSIAEDLSGILEEAGAWGALENETRKL